MQTSVISEAEADLVREFILTDALIWSIWADSLRQKAVETRELLAPALRHNVAALIVGAICRNPSPFAVRVNTTPEERRDMNRRALRDVFGKQGLGPEFVDRLWLGFLDNDFHRLAEDQRSLHDLSANHHVFSRPPRH
jgi:hypothetical protein